MQIFTVFFLLPLIFTMHAEVVKDFKNKCDQFFYKESEPQLKGASSSYVHICQRLDNKYHFATLYDKDNRIPVYSAYKYSRDDGKCKRDNKWRIEPQLVNQNWDYDMMTAGELRKKRPQAYDAVIGTHQAIDSDYEKTGYDRGHLNPVQHHEDRDCIPTFTLTNAVPQDPGLNRGFWRVYEENTHLLFKTCAKTYVLVGAIPSKNNQVKNRVNIPEHLWHAYCCLDNNNKPIKSGAAHVQNVKSNVVECSVKDLERFLGVGVQLFNNCG